MPTISFSEAVQTELEYVRERRAAAGLQDPEPPGIERSLCGLAMSGGGIRSAIFNLGVLQAFQQWGRFREIDYVSTVSGGGYVGTCLSVLMRMKGAAFPFEPHGPVVRYLRGRSQYIDPAGLWLRATSILLLGLGVNLLTVAPVLLATAFTIAAYSRFRLTDLLGFPDSGLMNPLFILMLLLIWQTISTLFQNLIRSVMWPMILGQERALHQQTPWNARLVIWVKRLAAVQPHGPVLWGPLGYLRGLLDASVELEKAIETDNWRPLRQKSAQSRHFFRRQLELTVKVLAVLAVLELQPLMLRLVHTPPRVVQGLFSFELWTAVFGVVAAVVPLLSTSGLPLGNRLGKIAPHIAVTAGTVALYFACLLLAEWLLFGPAHDLWTVAGLQLAWHYATTHLRESAIALGVLAALAAVYVVVPMFFLDLNERSIHGYYRDSLGETFVVYQERDGTTTRVAPEGDLKLSDLNAKGSSAPYHLFNATLNLPTDRELRNRGRMSDFFLMTRDVFGNDRVGYAPTADLERAYGKFTAASAMATSGAAASPHMGLFTRRPLVLIMSLLNLRLGCWLPNPRSLSVEPWFPNPFWLFRELRGNLRADQSSIYVSDGGHIENSGAYQLLKRRCHTVFAVDASTDPHYEFECLAALKRYARVDLGVEIDIDVTDLRPNGAGLSASHCAIGSIRYPASGQEPARPGRLCWIKPSFTGDESVEIQSYKARAKDFPHEPLSDQFFDEGQFEAYSLLGFHTASELFAAIEKRDVPTEPAVKSTA